MLKVGTSSEVDLDDIKSTLKTKYPSMHDWQVLSMWTNRSIAEKHACIMAKEWEGDLLDTTDFTSQSQLYYVFSFGHK